MQTPSDAFRLCSEKLETFRHRSSQNKMADIVFENFKHGGTLLIEAETGIGKTFAYLIPAMLSGKTVVVSTATKALQDQLVEKDLPLLRSILAQNVQYTTLKGVSNYVCKRKLFGAKDESGFPIHREPAIDLWLKKTERGEIKELEQTTWNKNADLTTTSDHRLGSQCPYFQTCFVTKSRRSAATSEVIVVNHHLLSQDLRIKASTGRQAILPPADLLVVDEAHRFVDVFSSQLGFSIDKDTLENARDEFFNTLESLHAKREFATGFERAISSWNDFLHVLQNSLVVTNNQDTVKLCAPVEGETYSKWLDWDNDMDRLVSSLLDWQPESKEPLQSKMILSELQELRTRICFMAELENSNDNVYWVSFDNKGGFKKIESRPIGVSRQFRNLVLESDFSSVVLTSATLQTNKNFDHIQSRLGLEDAESVAIPNQFDYTKNSILYIPRDLPVFDNKGYEEELFNRITSLLAITKGKAFVLFTSHRMLDRAFYHFRQLEWPTVFQGQSSKTDCLADFKRQENAVLFGTGTFWEGIDIPGDKLSQVIIDRLPFQSPSEPLCAALLEKLAKEDLDPFAHHQLPQAILALRQGIGRLIRREDDKGILSILDNRLVTKSYGKSFISALPPFTRTSALKRVETWWADQSISSKEAPSSSQAHSERSQEGSPDQSEDAHA